MIRSFWVLAWNGFREARRNRVTVVLAVFALGLILAGALLSDAAVAAFYRVLVDIGLGSMSLVAVLLAIFLSSGLVSREIERRTIFLVVSKPVSRGTFLLGRMAGNLLTLTVLLAGMFAVFAAQMALSGYPLIQPHWVALLGLWFELLLLSSLGLALSSFSGQLVSSAVALAIYFAGHLSGDLYALANKSDSAPLRALGKAAYYLLPNLERLNFRGYATYGLEVPAEKLWQGILYAVAYTAGVLSVAVLVFRRRDFK